MQYCSKAFVVKTIKCVLYFLRHLCYFIGVKITYDENTVQVETSLQAVLVLYSNSSSSNMNVISSLLLKKVPQENQSQEAPRLLVRHDLRRVCAGKGPRMLSSTGEVYEDATDLPVWY